MGRLDGKVALISGGARGQGAVEARMFAAEGACVVFGDILDDEGRRVEAEIRELGGQATYVHLDVTSESDWQSAVDAAVSEYGKLNVLVNNAGIVLGRSIEEMTVEEWDRLFDVNAKACFLGTKTSLPALREAGGGSIVNISSTAGLVGNDYNLAGYSSTKGAVRLFTKSTAIQHAGEGIRCNSVHPGPSTRPCCRSPAPIAAADSAMRNSAVACPWAASAGLRILPTPWSTWHPMKHRSSPAAKWSWTAGALPCNVKGAPRDALAVDGYFEMVGAARFELATPCTPCRCATGLRYAPPRQFQGIIHAENWQTRWYCQ